MANIRTARRSGLVFRGGRSRRETLWGDVVPAKTVLNAAGGTIINVTGAAFLALRPFTIVRSHFEFLLRSDQAAAIEDQVVAFGIAVVSDQAVAIGVTAVPTPITDMGSDLWVMHKIMMAGQSEVAQQVQDYNTYTVESKGMRKVEEGAQLTFVGEFSAITQGAELLSAGRVLIKLH